MTKNQRLARSRTVNSLDQCRADALMLQLIKDLNDLGIITKFRYTPEYVAQAFADHRVDVITMDDAHSSS